jgi:hypothetical protein
MNFAISEMEAYGFVTNFVGYGGVSFGEDSELYAVKSRIDYLKLYDVFSSVGELGGHDGVPHAFTVYLFNAALCYLVERKQRILLLILINR